MRSSEAPVRRLTTRLSALRLPLLFGGNAFVPWLSCPLAKLGRKKRVARMRLLMPVIASGAKQSRGGVHRLLDCFVAALLAMTGNLIRPREAGEGDHLAKQDG